jgi:N-methylhydantoinase B
MATTDYDVIAAEVHRKALDNVTTEMGITLVRTSGSPVVTEANDFSTCLLDAIPEQLSLSPYILFHVGSSLVGTQVIAELVKDADDLRPGDGWIVNDPYTGGAMHQGDVSVIMPTFVGDELLGWSFTDMHVLDVGGVGVSGFAPGAHDVYQEGLRFPPVRVIRDGAIGSEWEKFIAANVRAPGPVLNDIRSMIASNNTAAAKLKDVVREFGVEGHREYCEINKTLSEQLLRERIAKLPDGVYESTHWTEFDGHEGPDLLLEVGLRLEIDGTDLTFIYSGVPQIDAFVNSTHGAMFGNAMTALLTVLVYGDLPLNSGLWRPITLDIGPTGTVVNAEPPAPVSNAHNHVGFSACKLAKELLCQACALSDDPTLRSRVAGQHVDGLPSQALTGKNQHGGVSVTFYMDNVVGVGGAAQTVGDGQDCYGMTCTTGGGIPDVETHEATDPVLCLWRRLVPNSGGPGQNRGGLGVETAYAIHYTDRMAGMAFNSCAQVPPRGAGGGLPGAVGTFYPLRDSNVRELIRGGLTATVDRLAGERQKVRDKISHIVLERGDVAVTTSGGGPGLGDPLLRPLAPIGADLRAGYITPAHAEAAYGVVLDADGGIVQDASLERRESIRRERVGGEPRNPLRVPAHMGVSVERRNGSWACASCEEALGATSENWRDAAVMRESPVAERFVELEMIVRDRLEPPRVLMLEYFCPGCAASLGVDVVTSDTGTCAAPILSDG